MFVDTHAHLDDGQFPDVEQVIAAAEAAGVERIINIGYGPSCWRSTLDLAARFSSVAYTLGLHPAVADLFSDAVVAQLAELVETHRPVGIGEAGIDLFRPTNPELAMQRAAFAFQIELAVAHDLPLVIHQRAAENEVYEQLSAADSRLRVVLHSFDASEKMLDLAIERGWYVGVGGLMTRRALEDLRRLLRTVPLDRIVLETDSPYLVPAGFQERRNTPASIPVIADRLARLRGIAVEEIARATTENALVAFPRLAEVRVISEAAR